MAEQLGSVLSNANTGICTVPIIPTSLFVVPKISVPPASEKRADGIIIRLPTSYPGHVLLTEDEGEILGVDNCPCGRKGKYFKIHGRIKSAELRGCSDTYENIDYIIGTSDINRTPMPVYDDSVCAFIAEISATLMKSPLIRVFPICRRWLLGTQSQPAKLKSDFGSTERRLGRGLCFHIAPSNIPVNFAFTYVFGLLAGNANIVRLPSKIFRRLTLCAQQ